ncbi:unnamed protein product [Caenorhabditis nigoni]
MAENPDHRIRISRTIARLERNIAHTHNNVQWFRNRRRKLQENIARCITCSGCANRFNCEERIPRILECGHTVCEHCIKELLEQKRGPIRDNLDSTILPAVSIECPKCTFGCRFQESQTEQFSVENISVMISLESFLNTNVLDAPEPILPIEADPLRGNETYQELHRKLEMLYDKEEDVFVNKGVEENRNKNLQNRAFSLLSCLTCLKAYENDAFVLKCGHTFCSDCLSRLFAGTTKDQPTTVRCPIIICPRNSSYQAGENCLKNVDLIDLRTCE